MFCRKHDIISRGQFVLPQVRLNATITTTTTTTSTTTTSYNNSNNDNNNAFFPNQNYRYDESFSVYFLFANTRMFTMINRGR